MLSLNKKLMYSLWTEYILQKMKILYATLILIKITGHLKGGYKLSSYVTLLKIYRWLILILFNDAVDLLMMNGELWWIGKEQ